jgi:hypothetical protein
MPYSHLAALHHMHRVQRIYGDGSMIGQQEKDSHYLAGCKNSSLRSK